MSASFEPSSDCFSLVRSKLWTRAIPYPALAAVAQSSNQQHGIGVDQDARSDDSSQEIAHVTRRLPVPISNARLVTMGVPFIKKGSADAIRPLDHDDILSIRDPFRNAMANFYEDRAVFFAYVGQHKKEVMRAQLDRHQRLRASPKWRCTHGLRA